MERGLRIVRHTRTSSLFSPFRASSLHDMSRVDEPPRPSLQTIATSSDQCTRTLNKDQKPVCSQCLLGFHYPSSVAEVSPETAEQVLEGTPLLTHSYFHTYQTRHPCLWHFRSAPLSRVMRTITLLCHIEHPQCLRRAWSGVAVCYYVGSLFFLMGGAARPC